MELSRRAFNLGSVMLAAPSGESHLHRLQLGHVELKNPLPFVTEGTGTFRITGQSYRFLGGHDDAWWWSLGHTHYDGSLPWKSAGDRVIDTYFQLRQVISLGDFHHLDAYSWVGGSPRTLMAKGSWASRSRPTREPEGERYHVVLARRDDVYCLETFAPFGHAAAQALRESFRPVEEK